MDPHETIHRPDPGLGRGLWEAPPWVFGVLALAAVVATILYVLVRMGKIRVRQTKPTKEPKG